MNNREVGVRTEMKLGRGLKRGTRPSAPLLFVLIAAFVLTVSVVAPTWGQWLVKPGRPETVVLNYYRSLSEILIEWMHVPEYYEVTIHEYTRSTPLGSTEERVETTGNSLTFNVKAESMVTSFAAGSGAKIKLPIRLFYVNGKISDTGGQSDKTKVTASIYSASLREIENKRKFSYTGAPSPSSIYAARRSRQKAGNLSKPRLSNDTVVDLHQQYCGFEMFRWEFKFARLNDLALSRIPKPFDTANIFVKFTGEHQIGTMIYCTPGSGGSICSVENFLNTWAPYTLTYDSSLVCETEDLLSEAASWMQSRIVEETVVDRPLPAQ
jgi:hypothetical protein